MPRSLRSLFSTTRLERCLPGIIERVRGVRRGLEQLLQRPCARHDASPCCFRDSWISLLRWGAHGHVADDAWCIVIPISTDVDQFFSRPVSRPVSRSWTRSWPGARPWISPRFAGSVARPGKISLSVCPLLAVDVHC